MISAKCHIIFGDRFYSRGKARFPRQKESLTSVSGRDSYHVAARGVPALALVP